MQLASNRPGTVFSVREPRLDASRDERWQKIGEGQQVEVTVPNQRLEISARAPGYREKVVRLTEPVARYEFEFLEAERDGAAPDVASQAPPIASPGVPAAAPGVPPFSGNRHALIIGISTYQSTDLAPLANARRDAEALADFLRSPAGGNIAASRVHLLLDDEATRAEIIGELIKMASEADQGDLILLYFAGHARVQGGDDSARFLMPFDAKPNNPKGSAIDEKDLVAELDQAEPHRQLLMLDCCFAGGATVRGEVENVWGRMQSPARVILTSTKGNETAWDGDRNARNGPFMSQVLRALSGELPADTNEDRRVTVAELYNVIAPQIRGAATAAGLKMTPQLYGDWADKLEILKLR